MFTKVQVAEKPLTDKIAKARRENRTQQALELVRQLVKQEPTDEHRELLRQVTLERGRQLQADGKPRDAVSVYTQALTLGGAPEYVADVAQHLATCGGIGPALAALPQLTDPVHRQRVVQSAADAALAEGPQGKVWLPADLHPAFDLIVQAFAHYEAGRDDEARAALQAIGLQSPFLEWKLLLRGLIAHATNDNARALENWQRLDTTRLSSRLCATLRAAIDPAFLAVQPVAVQETLRNKTLQQQGLPVASLMRELRDLLHKERLAPAFRKAEPIVAILKRDQPALLARFAQCFYWAIIDHGEPEDIARYGRVFGFPADDPQLHRLTSLALETRGLWPDAHKAWQDFINEVGNNPTAWPGESGPRVQALIWARMAENAGPTAKRKRASHPIFGMFADEPPPALKPTAEQCLEKAIKLAPDRLDSYVALMAFYRMEGKDAKAKKVGQDLLKRFPDHAQTMLALGVLCMESKEFKKAQEHFESAIKANPLDRDLRTLLARAKQNYGLALTLEGKFDQAREQYEQALPLRDGSKTPLLCQWAVAEVKAKNLERAAELIAQAQAEPDHRLACLFSLVGESVRAKLPTAEKKRIAQDFKDALAQTPTPPEILVLLESAAHQRNTHEDSFVGQKTQEKTILKFLDSVKFSVFDEKQLTRLCDSLRALDARKPWLKCLNHARRQFKKHPNFCLSFADYYLAEKTYSPKTHLIRDQLDKARKLVEELPRGEQQQQFLELIKSREAELAELSANNPSMRDVMDRIFGGFGPDMGDDDDEDDSFW
jgi:tetratricopeptide (TPR) repeat protein